jgi:hypothetical protein
MNVRSELGYRVAAAALLLSSASMALARPSQAEASERAPNLPSSWFDWQAQMQSGVVKIPGTRLLEIFYKCDHFKPNPIVDVNPYVYASAYSTNPASGDAIAARYPYNAPELQGIPPRALKIRLSGIALSADVSQIHAEAIQLPPMPGRPAHQIEVVDTGFNCRGRSSPGYHPPPY